MNAYRRQKGAFLIIALILIVVISGLGVATISISTTSARVSGHYSKYNEAKAKATSMAIYAYKILESYDDRVWPGPGTCTSSGTCNVISSGFPHNGRPVLAWISGLSNPPLLGSSQSDAFWTTNGFEYEETFAGSGNARVIVEVVGTDTTYPYERTFRIVGYATDNTGTVQATHEMFYSFETWPADPGNGTCAGGCNYGECCASGSCVTTQAGCESATSVSVPPGWTCHEYYVDNLGYNASTCANQDAIIWSANNLIMRDYKYIEKSIDLTGYVPYADSFTQTGDGSIYETSNYTNFTYNGQWGTAVDFLEENIPGNTMPTWAWNKLWYRPISSSSKPGYEWTCRPYNAGATGPYIPFECDADSSVEFTAPP